ncbi:hypothetical protein P4S64_04165, partial [Vibrio sp. M60_M31a]
MTLGIYSAWAKSQNR